MLLLTKKKQLFVTEYVKDFNGRQSAIRAGYSPDSAEKQAYRLLQEPFIKELVAEQLKAKLERTSVTSDWIISQLKHEALFSGEGFSHGARVSALATLAKVTGMYFTQPVIDSKVTFVFNDMPSKQQRPLIEYEP
jgi:phage terminase small subunit